MEPTKLLVNEKFHWWLVGYIAIDKYGEYTFGTMLVYEYKMVESLTGEYRESLHERCKKYLPEGCLHHHIMSISYLGVGTNAEMKEVDHDT